ncbi:hypothetical protein SAMCCGM7_pC1048 (plasmid) [Sinorhizobium americanum CCGM7]|nr:hypothetical protein SAMCCGM7_pC1048 [Sinorhizobium americanum CCGM7]
MAAHRPRYLISKGMPPGTNARAALMKRRRLRKRRGRTVRDPSAVRKRKRSRSRSQDRGPPQREKQ